MYAVVDLETTMNSPISSPSFPMWPLNNVAMVGVRYGDTSHISDILINGEVVDYVTGRSYFKIASETAGVDTIVGHNIKFDLLYALKNKWITPKRLTELKVWDTQLAEYLLSGQTRLYPSLDEVSKKYGGTLKDDKIKEYWEKGVSTECIPADELSDYLKGDLENTELVYLKQREIAAKWGMKKLIHSQMNTLIAITIMEYNGLKIDTDFISGSVEKLTAKIEATEALLSSRLLPFAEVGRIREGFQWSSSKDVSALLFGGEFKEKESVLVGTYKNGKPKYKQQDKIVTYPGCKLDPDKFGSVPTKLGYYTVDDTVLKSIDNDITKYIISLREYSKQKSTYFENLQSLITPYGYVHPNLSMVSTKTGRLSCNKPNIQNQTTIGGIKRSYISRFKHGKLVEMDFSQLEMVGLAIVSEDVQLMKDIKDGVDTHSELYRAMYGVFPTKDQRKAFKPLTFGLVYGAGAKTLAEQGSCSVADAKKFIEVFYNRYKGVKRWHDSMLTLAEANKSLTTKHTLKGFPMHAYLHRMPTGRMYVFNEYDNEWKKNPSFSPTELKNWPIQGFSTGDIVPHMVGYIVNLIYSCALDDSIIPIMTVHDSILFDWDGSDDRAVTKIQRVLNDTSLMIEAYYGIKMPVDLKVGVSTGPNWGDMV